MPSKTSRWYFKNFVSQSYLLGIALVCAFIYFFFFGGNADFKSNVEVNERYVSTTIETKFMNSTYSKEEMFGRWHSNKLIKKAVFTIDSLGIKYPNSSNPFNLIINASYFQVVTSNGTLEFLITKAENDTLELYSKSGKYFTYVR